MPRLSPVPDDLLHRPFTYSEARERGVTRRVLMGPRFERVHPEVYRPTALEPTFAWAVHTAGLALPDGAIASHDTAARLLGLPLPPGGTDLLHFWVPDTFTGLVLDGVVLHRFKQRPATTLVGGRVVTTPGKTFIDMATRLDLPDLVALGDAVVKRTGVLPLELRRLAREPRRRWIRKARQAARLVRANVDSAPETHLRLAILDEFLPEPETGRDVFDDVGGWIARPDLSWPQWKVAIEYDGEHHLKERAQYNRDIGRRESLEDAGWIVIVVTSERLYKRRPQTIARIQRALVDRGAPIF